LFPFIAVAPCRQASDPEEDAISTPDTNVKHMTLTERREALALAEQAREVVQADPQAGAALAEDALDLARARRDTEGEVAALHALGFARYALGDSRALSTIRLAVRAGERHGHVRRAALARRNLALYLAYAGRMREALREIDAAQLDLRGVEGARTFVFRIAVYEMAGRGGDAIPGSAEAARALRRRGDRVWEARLRYNRGRALTRLGEHRRARGDLERARDLYDALQLAAAAADARIELARVRLREGDFVGCLAELDAVDAGSLSDWAACWLYLCRAEAFLSLRLLPEAKADLAKFEEGVGRAEAIDSLNNARLEAARLALAAGDGETAEAIAASAGRAFAARGQRSFASAAAMISLAAAARRRAVPPASLRSGAKAVKALEADGRRLDALRGHLALARAAAVGGHRVVAARELAAARALERRGTVDDRIELRHVEALSLLGSNDPVRAERRLRDGLELLEHHRARLGAAELRATSSALGVDLSQLGLEIALTSRRAEPTLAWAERLRGNALRLPVTRPAADRTLRNAQAELRALEEAMRAEQDAGRSVAGLSARRAALEATIRSRSRLAGASTGVRSAAATDGAARRAFGGRALVEYVELDGRLFALTQSAGTLRLHELGEADPVSELEWLRFSLTRLARGGPGGGQAATLANARASAAALDRLLVAPLLDAVGDAPLVIVPTGALHALPWGALPSFRGRPVTVAPSLSTWLDLHTRSRRRTGRTALVAGPRLRHASREVRDLAASRSDATVLTGKEATVEATLAALDGASLAHVACHGRFRADSPLFSALELADGPLTALDLQRLKRAPDLLVLSACDVALSKRHPGDELLGLSAALIAAGTRTIVASVVPVPDAAARRLMLDFHRHVAAGAPPATALAAAQADLRRDRSALAGFVCLGFG
jgi:hypothetical protein